MLPCNGNYHEPNVDWLICRIKEALAEWTQMEKEFDNLNDAFLDLKEYVTNYFENLDVQDEINNKLDELVADGTISNLLATINRTVVDVTTLGIKNDGTDVSDKLNEILSNGSIIPYFPNGKYLISNIDCSKVDELIFSENALIYGKDFEPMFVFNNKNGIKITNGVFNHGETPYPNRVAEDYYNAIFLFTNCKNIEIRGVTMSNMYGGNGIRAVTCDNILISNVTASNFVGSAIGFSNGCSNCSVLNSVFSNGVKINNFMYSYGIATGVSNFNDNVPSYINNMKICNCEFENMSWEGCDCHGGNDIIFSNNRFHNCARFFTCYYDDRPLNNKKFNQSFKNWTFENLHCVNDSDMIIDDTRNIKIDRGITVFGSTSHHVYNVKFKNCYIKNMVALNGNTPINHEGIIGLSYENVNFDGLITQNTIPDRFMSLISCFNAVISLIVNHVKTNYSMLLVTQSNVHFIKCVLLNDNETTSWVSGVDGRAYRVTYNEVNASASEIPTRNTGLLYEYNDEYGLYNNDKGLYVSSLGLRSDIGKTVTITGNSTGNENAEDNTSWIMFDSGSASNISTRNFLLGQIVSITYGSTTINAHVIDFVGYGIKVNKYIPQGECTVKSLEIVTNEYNWSGYQKS